jgi:signal peptidase II
VQAARGTPLTGASDVTSDVTSDVPSDVPSDVTSGATSDESDVGAAPPDRPQQRSLLPLLLAVAALVVAIDQVAKAIAVAQLTDHAPVELLGGALTLRLIRNPGAAFGLATGFTVVFTIFAVVVAVVVVRIGSRLRNRVWAIALAMLLGGAVGNLIDRLFREPGALRGHVVDFLELPHWPVFNLADSSIVCAGALLVLLTFRGVPYDR